MDDQDELQRWAIAEAIYRGRMRASWGRGYRLFPDYRDAKMRRTYSHNPIAEVDLALASADEVIKTFQSGGFWSE